MLTRTPRGLRTGYAYGLRVLASCVLYVPEAQGSLPRGATHCTYGVRVPASGVPYRAPWHLRQRDASITVRDADGELLLIEAAYCLPRWLTPEIALNRVFLRHGEVKLVPKAVAPLEPLAPLAPLEPLHLSHALPALRADTPALRCPAVTAAVRARVEPLLHDARGVARGPPRHRARCLLPEPLAQLLAADPTLAAAAAHAFCERDGDDMKRASRARRFAPHGRAVVAASVGLSLCMYSKVRQARFLPPPGTSLAPPDASAAQRRAARHGQSAAWPKCGMAKVRVPEVGFCACSGRA